ncbi:hypothetical protein JR316_0006865 [Psilocybe cubensis]|uniref:Uncharacterized protein n=2 Tax=Psilocybe cubensis TaxID=181762 RepID=A0A8H7XMB0_PSICU|nr:hypothetical protein JR316_0006865 [Psilocybe cubensis]KAH9480267.1 hypothetical protein JR316_0006865 [Psilocybe cubensis]
MTPLRLIIDLNRCFEPNAFNTGPPIPSSPYTSTSGTSSLSGDTFELLESRWSTSTPDLTSSPASSVGSSLHSLTLEDEEIRKIFANPEFECTANSAFQKYDTNIGECSTSGKDELNPLAAPFTPSFLRVYCPETVKPVDPTFQPSPLDLGFNPVDFTYPSPHSNEYVHHDSHYRQCVPLPAVYSPGPLRTSLQLESDALELATAVPRALQGSLQYMPPVYYPLLQEALLPESSDRLRKILAGAIVNGSTKWDIETLLDLAEMLGEEACKPNQHSSTTGRPITACDASRYTPINGLHELDLQQDGSEHQSSENVVADVARHLYVQLNEIHEELGQTFAWNLRETILTRFIHCWDGTKPSSINYKNRPHIHYVRSALTLCKSIAALFTRGLIMKAHISMCLSILMKDLMSVEHFEALAIIVLGCGSEFWCPAAGDPITTVEVEVAPGGVVNMTDGSLLLSTSQERATVKVLESDHVTYFLSGLAANVAGRNLRGEESVVGQGWGKGQLAARIRELVDSVKLWESILMNPSTVPAS